MGKKKQNRVCLSMIVENEAADIKRCLDSVAKHIDYWVISDTGSEDNTMELIQEIMDGHGIPGELHQHEWEDFSTNRNYALEIAKTKAKFVLCMDADDNFVMEEDENPFRRLNQAKLKHVNLFHLMFRLDQTMFNRGTIIRSSSDCKYVGVLHEYIARGDGSQIPPEERVVLKDFGHIIARASPHKRFDTNKEKYLNDAKVLKDAFEKEPENTRYVFYIAQSYHLAEEWEEALNWYTKRHMMGEGLSLDEVYLSKYEIAKIVHHLKCTEDDCRFSDGDFVDLCIRAWEEDPTRVEPMYMACAFLLNNGRPGYAFGLSELGTKTMRPRLTHAKLEKDVYDYKWACIVAQINFKCGWPDKGMDIITRELEIQKERGDQEGIAFAEKVKSNMETAIES